jgi:hypothetical protein
VRSTPESLVLEFDLPEVTLEPVSGQDGEYVRVRASGLEPGAVPGAPQLPQTGTLIGLPPAGQATVQVLEAEEERVPLSIPVYPVPVPVAPEVDSEHRERGLLPGDVGASGLELAFALDAEIYGQDASYPARVVELGEPGWVRDRRVAPVVLHPVRCNPVRGERVLTRRLVVEIRFEDETRTVDTGAPAQRAPSAAFEDLFRSVLLNDETSREWRANESLLAGQTAGRDVNALAGQQGSHKVYVDADGLYRLTYAALQAAGVPVGSVDPRTFQFYEQGREVAIQVTGQGDGRFDPGDAIFFYGRAPRGRYVERNVYWLRYGERTGRRMASRSVVSAAPPHRPTWTTARYQANRFYDPLFPGADGDHWYSADLRAGDRERESETFTIALMSPANVPTAILRLYLVGYTQTSLANPDHHATVLVNGQVVDSLHWDGKGEFTKAVSFGAGILRAGENTVTLRLPGDTGASVEGMWVDALELDYALQSAAGDEAHLRVYPGTQSYAVGGWTSNNLRAYDVTNPQHPAQLQGLTVSGSGRYTLSFADVTQVPLTYYVLTAAQIRSPLSVVADAPSDLDGANNRADYLVIAHRDYLGAVQPLVAHRRAQGLEVKVVDVQDVYDEFGGGLLDPEAIRSFVAYALSRWALAPTYVLLVGDGHYDFNDYFGYGSANTVPPYLGMVDPWWGETAADNRYAAVVGDDILPDVLLGRLPVSSVAEARAAVRKIVQYEQSPWPGQWGARHVLVADRGGSGRGGFAGDLDAIYDAYISDPWVGEKIYLKDLSAEGAKQRTLAAWQQGALLVNFVGHSSWHQWTVDSIFDNHDVPALRNDRQWPVLLSMTCFTGFFHHPEYGTLDEMLVRLEGGGAVAAWSPSGLGLQSGHRYLQQSFYHSVFERSETELGPVVLAAKLGLYAYSHAYDDLVDTYHLFGDPAMDLNVTVRYRSHMMYLPTVHRDAHRD